MLGWTFAIIIIMAVEGLIIYNVFNWAYHKSQQDVKYAGNMAVEKYKAEQIWEYEDRPTPLIRRNIISGQVQKRYWEGDMLRQYLTNWRTVLDLDLKKELKKDAKNKK